MRHHEVLRWHAPRATIGACTSMHAKGAWTTGIGMDGMHHCWGHLSLHRSSAFRCSTALLLAQGATCFRIIYLAFVLYYISYSVYSSTPCTLHVLLLYFNVLYIVAYSTYMYFRCILLYSMYSAEGECTLMYLGVLCCVAGVYMYSTRTPSVLQWYSANCAEIS